MGLFITTYLLGAVMCYFVVRHDLIEEDQDPDYALFIMIFIPIINLGAGIIGSISILLGSNMAKRFLRKFFRLE